MVELLRSIPKSTAVTHGFKVVRLLAADDLRQIKSCRCLWYYLGNIVWRYPERNQGWAEAAAWNILNCCGVISRRSALLRPSLSPRCRQRLSDVSPPDSDSDFQLRLCSELGGDAPWCSLWSFNQIRSGYVWIKSSQLQAAPGCGPALVPSCRDWQ